MINYAMVTPSSANWYYQMAIKQFKNANNNVAKNKVIGQIIRNWWYLAFSNVINGSGNNSVAVNILKWLNKNHVRSIYSLQKVAKKNSRNYKQFMNAKRYLQQFTNQGMSYVHYQNHQIKSITEKELLSGFKQIEQKADAIIL